MRWRIFGALLVTGASICAAGDKPSVQYTGNARIDFFSDFSLTRQDSTSFLRQAETSPPAEKRSPFVAGLLSLAVPGAGQVYNQDYWKAGLFLAAEAASWIIAYNYDKDGDRKTDEFQLYANEHWSAVRYANWTLDNLSTLHPDPLPLAADQYADLIYPDGRVDPEECGPPFSCIDWGKLNQFERDVASGVTNGYTHVLPGWNQQQYYELIGKYDQFSMGWDDANPLEYPIPIRSNSKRFYEYAAMRANANHYYDVASAWVAVAVINHVLSAAEAFWSASRYNKTMEAEVSMHWQRTAFGLVPETEAKVKVNF